VTAETQNALVPVVTDDGSTVSLAEALNRLLPHCNNNPFEVANWLNLRQQTGKVRLLGDGEPIAPNANPSILGVMARIPPDGKAELYVEVRRSIDGCYQKWAFQRESFEANLPGVPAVNKGGRPPEYDRERLVTEALIYTIVDGWPDSLNGVGGLFEKLKDRLGESKTAGRTQLFNLFTPIQRRIDAEKKEKADQAAKKKPPFR
jgi:hypothetical protein